MPSAAEFAAAQKAIEVRRTKRSPVSASPVVGLFSYRLENGETIPLKSVWHGGGAEQQLVARDERQSILVSVRAVDLEVSLLEQLVPALTAIAEDELETLVGEPASSETDDGVIEEEINSLNSRLRKVLHERTQTDHAASIEHLTTLQRDLEGQISSLQAARGEQADEECRGVVGPETALDLGAAINRSDPNVRSLLHAVLDECFVESSGEWKALMYWSNGSQVMSHPLQGQVTNRARGYTRANDPVDLWMAGQNVDQIHLKLNQVGRNLERETLVNHYLRPQLGGTLATCTSGVVQQIAIGVLTGNAGQELQHGEEWAARVRELYFNADGTVKAPSDFGDWSNMHPSQVRDDVVRILVASGGEVSLEHLAAVLEKDIHNLRTLVHRWPNHFGATSTRWDPERRVVAFWKCPHCGERKPAELACPEPSGPICTVCGKDDSGLTFDSSFAGAFLRGYSLDALG